PTTRGAATSAASTTPSSPSPATARPATHAQRRTTMSEPTPEVDPAVGQVRLLMADVGDDQYLDDTQVAGYLELNTGNVRRAAADALDAIATSETLVGKVIRTQDLQTDGTKVADSLRKHADRLRAQANTDDIAAAPWHGFALV